MSFKVNWLLVLGLVLAAAGTSRASTFVAVSDEDLTRDATVVVEATVAGVESVAGESISTYITIDPSRILKGAIPLAPFVIRERGGQVDGRREWIWGNPEYVVGERVLLFLKRGDDGVLHTLHLTLGKFAVAETAAGETVTQDLGYGAVVYTPFRGGLRRAPLPQSRSLSDFVAAIEAGVESEPDVHAAIDLVPAELWGNSSTEYSAEFTFLGGSTPYRWFEPDTGATVFYKIDQTGDAKLGFASSRVAFNRALNAWTNVETGSLILADGGAMAPVAFDDGWSCPNGNRVTFNDPFNEIDNPSNCGGVLGIGGFCGSGHTTVVNGMTFNRITGGRVMMNNGFSTCSYWTETNMAEILTHEIGHSIGFGHSADSDATMRGSAHLDGRGNDTAQNPLIRADDRAGVEFSYPSLGTPTPTFTATGTAVATVTPVHTATSTQTALPTSTQTALPTSTQTALPSSTATLVPTAAPTATATTAAGGAPASATFLGLDTATQGSWKGVYGADGFDVIANAVSAPSYATVVPRWKGDYTFAGSTSDPRALQKAESSTDRVAACWFSGSAFEIEVNLADGQEHQVALYLLDWNRVGRAERVEVRDAASGAVLDSREMSGFGDGRYLVWNLAGNVILRVTNTAGFSNAVVSGLFFDPTGGWPPPQATPTAAPTATVTVAGGAAASSAAFVGLDTTTPGRWTGVYGLDGYDVLGAPAGYPSYTTVLPRWKGDHTFVGSTSDVRALQKPASSTDRMAACWFSGTTCDIEVDLTDGQEHQVALYVLDWNRAGRVERIEILDTISGALLDSREVSGFGDGGYLVWNLSGQVVVRLTNTAGFSNAVVSGLFFDAAGGAPPPEATPTATPTLPSSGTSAAFVGLDTTTQGSWKGVYGSDGYNVIGNAMMDPSYATAAPSGAAGHTFVASTGDVRALQKETSSTDRMAACWYSTTSFDIEVNLADGQVHQVALYLLDWNRAGRAERVEIRDASTGAVLDSREVGGFGDGTYLVWNLSGHLTIRVTNTAGFSNAVVSALFFDPPAP
jgi:hypothetical protein